MAAWIGSVTRPAARSSADCRNAAQVMAQAAASVSALWSGTYKATRASFAADVWPGDALLLNAPSPSLNAQVVVRAVKVSYRASVPDLVEYEIAFANDWADDLAIKTSATVPPNAWLPAPVAPTVLANLSGLTVTALNGSTVTVNTGATPPTGGGFEIRRARLRLHAGRGSGAGDAGRDGQHDLLPRVGQRPVLHPDVRRLHAAELFGVLGGAVHQFAGGVMSVNSFILSERSESKDLRLLFRELAGKLPLWLKGKH